MSIQKYKLRQTPNIMLGPPLATWQLRAGEHRTRFTEDDVKENILSTVTIWHCFHTAFVAKRKGRHSQHIVFFVRSLFLHEQTFQYTLCTNCFLVPNILPGKALGHQNSRFTSVPLNCFETKYFHCGKCWKKTYNIFDSGHYFGNRSE